MIMYLWDVLLDISANIEVGMVIIVSYFHLKEWFRAYEWKLRIFGDIQIHDIQKQY